MRTEAAGRKTVAVDVFSFGVIILQVDSGRAPGPEPDLVPDVTQPGKFILVREIERRQSDITAARTASLRALAERCLADDPTARPRAAELRLVLDEMLERARSTGGDEIQPVAAAPLHLVPLRGVTVGGIELIVPPGRFNRGLLCTIVDDELFVPDKANHCQVVFDTDGRQLRLVGEKEIEGCYGCAVVGGVVFVANRRGHCVKAYPRAGGALLLQFGSQGLKRPGAMDFPYGVAAWREVLLVTENTNHRVSVFATDGSFVARTRGREQDPGSKLDVKAPTGICTAGDRVFVATSSPHKRSGPAVAVFHAADMSIERYIGEDTLDQPQGVAVMRGLLVVADMGHKCLMLFDVRTGAVVGTLARNIGGGKPCGVAIRTDGVIFITTNKDEMYRVQIE